MWCPKPKPKVIARPKLIFRQFPPRKSPEPAAENDSQEEQQKEKQHDPHRDRRHYGMKHTDVTRIFLVEDRNCHVPGDRPYGLKKTDITRYLERVIPSHAFQASNAINGPSQTTPTNNNSKTQHPQPYKKGTRGDSGGAYATRPPSRCETRERKSRRQVSKENFRPETAPTDEMKRLSATNACRGHFSDKPTLADAGKRAVVSSPLKPIEEPKVPSPRKLGSKPGTAQTSESWGGLHGSESGLKDSSVGCPTGRPGSRSLTASTTHTYASRLQPVPE